jgi:O-antigen ligase
MPIQWLTLAEVGPFSLKLVYAAFLLSLASFFIDRKAVRAAPDLVAANAVWLVPFFFYLLILSVALYGSAAESMAPRQVFYLAGVIAIASIIAVRHDAPAILRLGSAAGFMAFIVVTEVKAWEVGLSWSIAIPRFLSTGDLDFVVYSFLREIFNTMSPDGEITVKASEKNSVAVCLFVLYLLFRIGFAGPGRDWVGMIMTGLTLLLLIVLNTRSILVAAAVSLVAVYFLRSVAQRALTEHAVILRTTFALIVAALLATLVSVDHPLTHVLSERMAFEDASTEGRMVQYQDTLRQIDENLGGSGHYESMGRTIHNLFLASWVQTGTIGFALVLVFYVSFILLWLRWVAATLRRPGSWALALPFHWVAVLPVMPVFRVWLSGDAGHLFLGEWVAVAAFVGLLLRNRRAFINGSHHPSHAARSAPRREMLDTAWSKSGRLQGNAS